MSTQHTHDLAISAVSYDALLVAEVMALVASRLPDTPTWDDASSPEDGLPGATLREAASRVVLVLSQRLWGSDELTIGEAAVLRDRARRSQQSILVVTLDDVALPDWMRPLRHRSLAKAGINAVVDFVLDAVAEAGGVVLPKPVLHPQGVSSPRSLWADSPPPFLGQTRAHGTLRRELDALGASLKARFDARNDNHGDLDWELHRLPFRVVARLGDVGITFSWLPGRGGAVADGRLMIIEWTGIATGGGIAAFRGARPARECVYRAESTGPDVWSWRVDRPNGKASSTVNLIGEWIAGATTVRALEVGDAA